MSLRNSNFNIGQCSYRLTANKKNTSRSMVLNHLNIPFCYTIEASFGILSGKQATTQDFIRVGEDLAETAKNFMTSYVLG